MNASMWLAVACLLGMLALLALARAQGESPQASPQTSGDGSEDLERSGAAAL
jgi:hypothetical protein